MLDKTVWVFEFWQYMLFEYGFADIEE